MDKVSGPGLPLTSLYDLLFGTSKIGKAFRALVKDVDKNKWDDATAAPLIPLAREALRALVGSQEFKQRWVAKTLALGDPTDVKAFLERNRWGFGNLRGFKQWFEEELGKGAARLSKETSAFLKTWVNTNGYRLPTPTSDIIHELLPFRPTTTRLYYRGYRFSNVGQLLEFHEKYGKGKAFPFESDRWSPWTTSIEVAKRFARFTPNQSQYGAMMTWLSRPKDKNYDGVGGYVMGSRIAPDQCLVDLSHKALPFGGGQHGDEGEVIVAPNTPLVAKVYDTYGNLDLEIAEFEKSYRFKPFVSAEELAERMLSKYGPFKVVSATGDETSGTVTVAVSDPDDKVKIPRLVNLRSFNPIREFQEHMYEAKWISDDTIAYRSYRPAQKVAHRFLSTR